MDVDVKVKTISDEIDLPYQADIGSVGYDLKAYFEEENGDKVSKVVLYPNQEIKINTGLAVEIPQDYFMLIVPRSSTGVKKGLMLKNTVGIIDSSYRGNIYLFFKNIGEIPIEIENNERIAQAIILPSIKAFYKKVDKLSETERGDGGFGSTNFDKNGDKVL